jgi:hypothetical protein
VKGVEFRSKPLSRLSRKPVPSPKKCPLSSPPNRQRARLLRNPVPTPLAKAKYAGTPGGPYQGGNDLDLTPGLTDPADIPEDLFRANMVTFTWAKCN